MISPYQSAIEAFLAGAPAQARRHIVRPYPDVLRALALVRSLINNVRSTIVGAMYGFGANPALEGRPNMAMHPPDHESWAWEPLETRQVQMGNEVWIILLALAAQPEGWYVRLSRLLEAAEVARDLILDGPYPDRASAVVSALGLISDALDQIGPRGAYLQRDGVGPPD
jgi:hypothetical protein